MQVPGAAAFEDLQVCDGGGRRHRPEAAAKPTTSSSTTRARGRLMTKSEVCDEDCYVEGGRRPVRRRQGGKDAARDGVPGRRRGRHDGVNAGDQDTGRGGGPRSSRAPTWRTPGRRRGHRGAVPVGGPARDRKTNPPSTRRPAGLTPAVVTKMPSSVGEAMHDDHDDKGGAAVGSGGPPPTPVTAPPAGATNVDEVGPEVTASGGSPRSGQARARSEPGGATMGAFMAAASYPTRPTSPSRSGWSWKCRTTPATRRAAAAGRRRGTGRQPADAGTGGAPTGPVTMPPPRMTSRSTMSATMSPAGRWPIGPASDGGSGSPILTRDRAAAGGESAGRRPGRPRGQRYRPRRDWRGRRPYWVGRRFGPGPDRLRPRRRPAPGLCEFVCIAGEPRGDIHREPAGRRPASRWGRSVAPTTAQAASGAGRGFRAFGAAARRRTA
jgi:hypothetical protein